MKPDEKIVALLDKIYRLLLSQANKESIELQEVRLYDASYVICGYSSNQRLIRSEQDEFKMYLLADATILAQRPNYPDQIISPSYWKTIQTVEECERIQKEAEAEEAPPGPKSPARIKAEKEVAERKAAIEKQKGT